jgi:hypothetical protein
MYLALLASTYVLVCNWYVTLKYHTSDIVEHNYMCHAVCYWQVLAVY